MKKTKTILSIILVLAMVCALAACGGKDDTSPSEDPSTSPSENPSGDNEPATADTIDSITIGVSGMLGRFLAGLSPAESKTAVDAVFDSCFRIDPKTKEIISDVCVSWDWTDDTTFVIQMRDDIYFNNGDHATAEDFLFSYQNHNERGSNYLANMPINWEESKVTGEYEVSFKFDYKFPAFTDTVILLVDKAWSQSVGWESLEWYNNPVGSGPYKVAEYVIDDHMRLVARDDYWNKDAGPIKVQEWVIKYYSDQTVMYMDLELGNIALCDVTDQDFTRAVEGEGSGYSGVLLPAGCNIFFQFGFKCNDIWYNQTLREAIAAVADWDAIGKLANGNLYVPALSSVPQESPEFVNPGKIEFNPEKAKQLLQECGYSESNPLVLRTFMMDTAAYKAFCETFQYYAEQTGMIKCDIQYGDISGALAKWLEPEGEIDFGFLFNNLGAPMFDIYNGTAGTTWTNGVNFAYVDDPEYQQLMESIPTYSDRDKQIEVSQQLQHLIYDKTLMIPFAELQTPLAFRTDVFTEEQIKNFSIAATNYQIGRLGMASAW